MNRRVLSKIGEKLRETGDEITSEPLPKETAERLTQLDLEDERPSPEQAPQPPEQYDPPER